MNAATYQRRLASGERLSRIVRNRDVSPEAPMDGFTAFLESLSPEARRRQPPGLNVHE